MNFASRLSGSDELTEDQQRAYWIGTLAEAIQTLADEDYNILDHESAIREAGTALFNAYNGEARFFHDTAHGEYLPSGVDRNYGKTNAAYKQQLKTLFRRNQAPNLSELIDARQLAQNAAQSTVLGTAGVGGITGSMKNEALMNLVAITHDFIYHTDGELNSAQREYLYADKTLPIHQERKFIVWTENQTKEPCIIKTLLNKLDEKCAEAGLENPIGGGKASGPYPTNPPQAAHNEILSAIATESMLRQCGLVNPEALLQVSYMILCTIPFKHPEFYKALEEALEETMLNIKANGQGGTTISDEEAHQIQEEAGKLEHEAKQLAEAFVNKADLGAFGLKPSDPVFYAGGSALERENNPALRNDAKLTGFDKACIGTAGFFRLLLKGMEDGSIMIRSDICAGKGHDQEYRHFTSQTRFDSIRNQLTIDTMIADARVVAGFLTESLQRENLGEGEQPSAQQAISGLRSHSLSLGESWRSYPVNKNEKVAAEMLSTPNKKVELFGKNVPLGLPGDEYAGALLQTLGRETIRRMAEIIYTEVVGTPDAKLRFLKEEHENIRTKMKEILNEKQEGLATQIETALLEKMVCAQNPDYRQAEYPPAFGRF